MATSPPPPPPRAAPFGSWKSPITAELIAAGSVALSDAVFGPGERCFWVEGRPTENGRRVVVEEAAGDRSPKEFNVRSRVHEYGGISFAVHGNALIFVHFRDQKLHLQAERAKPAVCLTPDASPLRFADFSVDATRKGIVAVCEDHTKDKPSDVVNSIVRVSMDGSGTMVTLAQGRDFYASPTLSPDGTKLAYVEWDHPNMPWDNTELWMADAADGKNRVRVAGGGEESVLEPRWSHDGSALFFLSDRTDFWNLYRFTVATGTTECVMPLQTEVGGPMWQLGRSDYAMCGARHICMPFTEQDGQQRIALLDLGAGPAAAAALPFGKSRDGDARVRFLEDPRLPATIKTIRASQSGATLLLLGGSSSESLSVVKVTLTASKDAVKDVQVLRRSFSPETRGVSVDGYISKPRTHVPFPTTLADGSPTTAFAHIYMPQNKAFVGEDGKKPPALVKIHGGPTSTASTTLRLDIQYWTSRGFCVCDVNYSGSTGYGRRYRNRLRGSWGIVDVNDVCAVAEYCVAQGLVDGTKLAIDGGSAGGFTTLAALTFRDTFTAGTSLYGVSDLAALAKETHKFESQYLDGLVAPWPEGAAIFEARSPIKHVDQLSCPLLLLQGDEDKVVPPNQATTMYESVKAKNIPCCLIVFKGEQHGFRKAENIVGALEAELDFYGQVFGFAPADEMQSLQVENLGGKKGPSSAGAAL